MLIQTKIETIFLKPLTARILSDILGCQVNSLPSQISLKQTDFTKLIHKLQLLKQNIPLDYILDFVYILDLKLKLSPAVLIPRPETEELIKMVRSSLKAGDTLVDLGCGSGFIGLSLAKDCKEVVFLDISEAAINNTIENAIINKVSNYTYQVSDGLPNLCITNDWVLVANLPYLPDSDKKQAQINKISLEPEIALYSGKDGLDLFYKVIKQMESLVNLPKFAWFELDPRNIHQAKDFLSTLKVFKKSKTHLDSNKLARFLEVRF